MKKLVITPNFTVEDIHKVREYNYEYTKNMSDEEKINYCNNKAYSILEEVFGTDIKQIKTA